MYQRSKEGATLALTVTAAFFIILLGIGFFFLVQLLGGGREAQHATDSGNLNLAKQAMVRPAVDPVGTDATEFAGLFNPNNKIDLKDYNRFVGKALIVALNASQEGTTDSLTHAQTVLNQVEGNNGVGQRLFVALRDAGQTKGFFDALAKSNSLRMLNWNLANQIDSDTGNYHVAFMRQNADAATNIHLLPGVIPPGSNHGSLQTSSTDYMIGYTPIKVTIPAGGSNTTLTLYGVPVRPNQQPHLVSQEQFLAESNSQLAGSDGTSWLPPNAFQSQSNAGEMHGGIVQTRSSAIVGAIDAASSNFQAEIPDGYIVINNTGSASAAFNPSGSDPFAGQLMGAGVFMGQAGPGTAVFSSNPADFTAVQNATYDSTGNIPMSTLNGTNFQPASPAMTQTQLNALHDYLVSNGGSDQCNNINSFPMESGGTPHDVNPNCQAEVADVYSALRTAGGGTGGTANNLMAIEYLKAEVIRIRGMFDDDGCGSINPATGIVTGLKAYSHPLGGSEINRVPFGNTNDTTTPTLQDLLTQTTGNGSIEQQIRQRLNEMHASANAAQLDAAFTQPVPFDKISYLYWNGASFASTTTPPPGWDVSFQAADGTTVTAFSQDNVLTDRYINISGDGGFPHPFDCPPGLTGFTKDSALWTPGSGYKNLLGVIQFTNTADVGVTWCCPC